MVEVNGATKHCRYEKSWLKSLCVMPSVEVFATQDGWMACWPNTTHYIDPYDTHVDQ